MTDSIIPHTLVPGTKASAAKVNENFAAITDALAEVNTALNLKINEQIDALDRKKLDNSAFEESATTIMSTDLSNLTEEGQAVLSKTYKHIMPDFLGKVTMIPGTFTPSTNGWLLIVKNHNVDGNYYNVTDTYTGTTIMWWNGKMGYNHGQSVRELLEAGRPYTIIGSGISLSFYPCKGGV